MYELYVLNIVYVLYLSVIILILQLICFEYLCCRTHIAPMSGINKVHYVLSSNHQTNKKRLSPIIIAEMALR